MATNARKPSKPAAKRKPAAKTPASKKPVTRTRKPAQNARGRKPAPKSGALTPVQMDLVGVALTILGTFLGAVVWGGWSGGPAGQGLDHGFRLLFGAVAVVVPLVLIVVGVLLIARESFKVSRTVQIGLGLFFAGMCLALTAGTLGVHGASAVADWTPSSLQERGGSIGQGLFAGASAVGSHLGAHLLAIFLLLSGVVLVSGISLSSLFRSVAEGAADLTKSVSSAAAGPSKRSIKKDLKRAQQIPEPEAPRILPPEPELDEVVIRATHVEAGAPPDYADAEEEPEAWTHPPEPEVEPIDDDVAPVEEDTDFDGARDIVLDESDLTPQGRYRDSVVDDPKFRWKQPPKSLLIRSPKVKGGTSSADRAETARVLVESLGHHGVKAEITGTVSGPHITRYELKLAPGTKVSKVAQLRDDLAYALASTDIRILAPIPGKQAVGVEVPNEERQMVTLGDVWQAPPEGWSPLTVWLGKDVAGRAIGADLARMPHLLVAGTTGAGKSGCVNAMLSSILLRATPREVRLVLVDPKQVELNHYESVPHLMTPVITNPRQAANALANLVREMEQRYALMAIRRTRGLPELNESREKAGEPPLPYILCVIDELADLMMVAPTEVEDSIIRLAQKARAVGIHLVLATQSPRVDVITGMIKANVPSRIAFAVSSQTDSRVILDQNGAETLLGQGDMLFAPVGTSKLQRIQGAYIDEAQIADLCEHWRKQGEPSFNEELLAEVVDESKSSDDTDGFDPDEDALLAEAINLVAQMQTASTSMLQRRLRVGYTRAGRLIDMLERRGVISGYEGSKPRQVLVTEADLPRVLEQLNSTEPAQASLDIGNDST